MVKVYKLDKEFGLDAENKTSGAGLRKLDGALASLESFYHGFNNRSIDVLKKVWSRDSLIQLDNPVGGMMRGAVPVMEVYDRIFNGHARVWVRLTDIVCYETADMVVFAGTEIGEFSADGETVSLLFRTTRCFGYPDNEKRWVQLHHHGSIDDADVLKRYQVTVRK